MGYLTRLLVELLTSNKTCISPVLLYRHLPLLYKYRGIYSLYKAFNSFSKAYITVYKL